MANLTTLVRSLFLSTALATLPAVYSLNCGGQEEKPAGCETDYDCRKPRICQEGKCEYTGNGSGGEGEEGPCGNSPLNGKYLWEVTDCIMGTTEPFASDCTGQPPLEFTGRTIYNLYSRDDSYELLRSGFQCSELEDGIMNGVGREEICLSYRCVFSYDPSIYVERKATTGTIPLKEGLWKLADTPWPGSESCKQQIRSTSWYVNCENVPMGF